MITQKELASYVDHSLLKTNLTYDEVKKGIEFAKETECATVCVTPNRVKMAAEILKGSKTAVCSVVCFPCGMDTTEMKVAETKEAYANGATEIDMVLDVSALKSGDLDYVKNDVAAVVNASPASVKVILENCFLTKEEIALAAKICEEAGAHYVKTSTGFASGGATLEDIAIMKGAISEKTLIKAAGGISTLDDSLAYIEAGCSRIGISKTQSIFEELAKRG